MKILKYLVAFGAVASLTTGCIKEELPTSYVSNEQMAESPAALVNGMNAWLTTFNTMGLASEQHYDFGWSGICMGTDALTPDVAVTDYGYDNGFLNWRGVTPELSQEGAAPRFIWNFCYSLINMANTLIGQIDPENMSSTQQEYLGQALVYRAMAYFHLARIFEYKGTEHGAWDGLSVPIVDENTSELMGRRNPRVETDKLYDELILPDLQNAVKYLEGYTRTAKNKVDQAVAYGMLARVYLQREQWKDAEEAATKAIELSGATPLTEAQWMSPTTGFNDISTPAWMWGIIVTADNRVVTTGICNFVSFMSPEATYGYSAAGGWSSAKQIDAALFAKIPDTDWRKRSWVNPDREKYPYSYYQTTLDKKTWENSIQDYTGFKFRPGEGNGVTFSVGSVADFPLMRVEEMYLIQAEAAGMQNLSRGKQLLETFVQTYRNPSFRSAASDGKGLQDEIFLQRQIEFWGEGIIMFDYKRLDKPQFKGYTGTNHFAECRYNSPDGNAPWTTLPLPLAEVSANTILKDQQNPNPVLYRGTLWR